MLEQLISANLYQGKCVHIVYSFYVTQMSRGNLGCDTEKPFEISRDQDQTQAEVTKIIECKGLCLLAIGKERQIFD